MRYGVFTNFPASLSLMFTDDTDRLFEPPVTKWLLYGDSHKMATVWRQSQNGYCMEQSQNGYCVETVTKWLLHIAIYKEAAAYLLVWKLKKNVSTNSYGPTVIVTCRSLHHFYFFADCESLLWNVVKVWIDVTEITVCAAPVLTEIQSTQQHFLVCVPDTKCNWKFFRWFWRCNMWMAICGWQYVDGQIHVCVILIWEFLYTKNEFHRQTPYVFATWEWPWDWKRCLVSTIPNNLQIILLYCIQNDSYLTQKFSAGYF